MTTAKEAATKCCGDCAWGHKTSPIYYSGQPVDLWCFATPTHVSRHKAHPACTFFCEKEKPPVPEKKG